MLPPRRQWSRPNRSSRSKLSSQKIVELSIVRAIDRSVQDANKSSWSKLLSLFTKGIRHKILLSNKYHFDAPRVALIEKDKNKKTYRPLATFGTEDQIVIGCAANCLRATIDNLMSKSSYAFRTKVTGEKKVRQHHDAVRALRDFILLNPDVPLFVAECDIQKFFDAVNHDIARTSLRSMFEKVRKQGGYFDRRLIDIFDAYLRAYNFPNSVEAIVPSKLVAMGKAGGTVPWVREEIERYYPDGISENIGVPQGGALSPIIANIVLHNADLAVERAALELGDAKYFYARYCDDMVLVSPDENVTRILFGAYIASLKKMKLPYHPPTKVTKFTNDYFDYKSKDVYAFGGPAVGGVSPWIAFLGYHIRYDGKLRVRKSSISKEIEKQISIYRDIIYSVNVEGKKMRVSARQALHRARMRLIAMSVGNAHIHDHGAGTGHEMCWVNGFELLKEYPHAKSQLRALDRVRARLLTKLRFRLQKVQKPLEGNQVAQKTLKFYGRPFSYFAQFQQKKRIIASSNQKLTE